MASDSEAPGDFPVLEAEIHELDQLNELRGKAKQLRRSGLDGLTRILENPSQLDEEDPAIWVDDAAEEPEDYVKPALLAMALSRDANGGDESVQAKCRERQLESLDVIQFSEILNVTSRSRVPIFQAARVLQATLHEPQKAFSESAMISLYRLVYELNSVSDANWSVGGARAREGAPPTAFVTGECTRAIRSLARLIDRCREAASHVQIRLDRLAALLDVDGPGPSLPPTWVTSELRRISLELHTVIRSRGRRSFLHVQPETIDLLDPKDSTAASTGWITDFLRDLAGSVTSVGTDACNSISCALRQVNRRYTETNAAEELGSIRHRQMQMAHSVAEDTLKKLASLAEETRDFGRKLEECVGTGPITTRSVQQYAEVLKRFVERYAKAYNTTQQLMAPARAFIDAVLDRELGRVEVGHFDAGELACAAASISELSGNDLDPRLDSAIRALNTKIGHNGQFPIPSVLGTDVKGYTLVLVGSEIIRAYAQLLQNTGYRVSPETVRNMLRYFEVHAIRFPEGGQLVGWTHDHPIFPRRAVRWTTALAVLALDRVVRLLDSRINNAVFRHFSVKTGQQLESTPPLSRLVYPDQGIAHHRAKDAIDADPIEISHLLQRMRCHLRGIDPPPTYGQPCYAAVFYGPPGTGKSTYTESLARTADVPLVEVTPSDIVVEGESHIERRARAVFKALSYLTGVVIVFDEFEHLLTSRQRAFEKNSKNLFDLVVPAILPKLKTLHGAAKSANVVYVLNTNHVGELDNAAIRGGRFDYKVGVFPPDPVSRAGVFAEVVREAVSRCPSACEESSIDDEGLRSAVVATAGAGMTWLSRRGNLVPLKEQSESMPPKTMLAMVFPREEGDDASDSREKGGGRTHLQRRAITDAALPPAVVAKAVELLAGNEVAIEILQTREQFEIDPESKHSNQANIDEPRRRDANHYGKTEIESWGRIVAWDAFLEASLQRSEVDWNVFSGTLLTIGGWSAQSYQDATAESNDGPLEPTAPRSGTALKSRGTSAAHEPSAKRRKRATKGKSRR